MVGAAIAYGVAGQGKRVLILDGADDDYRAAKANFGLVWVQGKGHGFAPYQRLSRLAAEHWPEFADTLTHETGIALDYERNGGLTWCVGEQGWQARQERLEEWEQQVPDLPACTEMLERPQLEKLVPAARLGPDVVGASYGVTDGHVNPLKLLKALHCGLKLRGAELLSNSAATHIQQVEGKGFAVATANGRFEAGQVVIAAGLGSTNLAQQVGLDIPLRPQRGQLLVTERLAPILPLPTSGIRQTAEGTVMIGLTQEEVGFDLSTTTTAAARMSSNALEILPELAAARLVRQWACLRIMTADGNPVYAESDSMPGAFVALCHSGVTLASFHAGLLSQALGRAELGNDLTPFHHRRFNVSTTA